MIWFSVAITSFGVARPSSILEAMGKRKGATQDASWVDAQNERLEAASKAMPRRPTGPTLEQFEDALTSPVGEFPRGEPVAPEAAHVRSPDAAAQLIHRRSGQALLKSGFEPQRHSVVVLGRPVQAPFVHTSA